MCRVGQTLPLKNTNTIEKPGTCSTSEELLPPQERWFRTQGHCGKEKKERRKNASCKQKKLRKRLGWQGTDPELLHYRLGRKEQENLQASSQVLKASKADGRKHSGSSYNSLTGLPKWHDLPRVWQQAFRALRFSPFTLGRSHFWLFLVCLGRRARKRAALAPACGQTGSVPVPLQKIGDAIRNYRVCSPRCFVQMSVCGAPGRLLVNLASLALRERGGLILIYWTSSYC